MLSRFDKISERDGQTNRQNCYINIARQRHWRAIKIPDVITSEYSRLTWLIIAHTERDLLQNVMDCIFFQKLNEVNEVCYLGVYCAFPQIQMFYRPSQNGFCTRTANGILPKLVDWLLVVQLLKQKCSRILLYALDVCKKDKRSMQSLDFTIMKLFKGVLRPK